MAKFGDIARRVVNRIAGRHADQERRGRQPQELMVIPGMPSAPEPCLLPGCHWSPETHPRNAIAQVKMNGIRAISLQKQIVTRQALPFDAAIHCLPALDRLERRFGCEMVFDGEYQEMEGFDATMSAFKRGEGAGFFYLFDAVPYAEWKANRFTMTLEDRLAVIASLVDEEETFLTFLPPVPAPTAEKAMELAGGAWARGAEGLVVKDAKSLYYRGRSREWQKLKRAESIDVVVVDVVVPENDLARAVALVRWNGRVHKVAAMPADIRKMIWRDINGRTDGLTGRIVEVEFEDRTETGALKGAKITRLREDKTEGED